MITLPEDPFIRELLPEFVESWIEEIQRAAPMARAKNKEDLYRLGHTLKGSAAQFCLPELSQLGIQLMGYAKNAEWEQAIALSELIRQQFIAINNWLSKNY
jgi:HPt (histidine-containing phosphotransfer) domain-containing protein